MNIIKQCAINTVPVRHIGNKYCVGLLVDYVYRRTCFCNGTTFPEEHYCLYHTTITNKKYELNMLQYTVYVYIVSYAHAFQVSFYNNIHVYTFVVQCYRTAVLYATDA